MQLSAHSQDARTLRGCQTGCSQPEGAEEADTNFSVPQQEEQADVIDDDKPHIDYEPEGLDPENETDAQEEEEENFITEYAKMELP